MKFATPWVVPIGTACLIGLLWLAVEVQGSRERQDAIESAIARNENLAIALESYVARTLQSADTLTRYVRANSETFGPAVALQQAIATGMIDEDLYQGLGIIDSSGKIVTTTMPGATDGQRFDDREHFREHVAQDSNSLYIGKPVLSKLLGEATIPLTRRINLPNGSFGGVVIAQISPSRFTEFYQSAHLRDDASIVVAGLDGVTRVRRAGDQIISGEDFSKASLFSHLRQAPAGSYVSNGPLDGILRFLSYRKLSKYPLVVAVGVSEQEVLSGYRSRQSRIRMTALIISIVILGFAGLLIFAFRRRDRALHQVLERERELKVLATHDVLTGVPNRALLDDRARMSIERARKGGRSMACLFVDLDNFKYHNDAHGHAVGDEILKRISQELRRLVRDGDTVARLGGDEFVVLLEDMGDAMRGASAVARKILERLAEPILTKPRDVTITASIGISLFPKDGDNLYDLLRHADAAMYLAKDGGRGRFTFYGREMSNRAAERLYIEEELRHALRLQQFELYYQPKVDLLMGSPVGVEALIRWNHPFMGLVSPADFIPIAEESGLILPIGEWVLQAACVQMKAWQEAGLPSVRMAVNVSALQFKQPEIVDVVARALNDVGLEPCCLELEITESMIIGRPELVTQRLAALKALGVTIALDDFGTGYSNLQYLKKLPLDALKIDRSFVSDIPDDVDGSSITKAIINMGSSLGLRVIAEGIETLEQASFLLLQGCAFGQGYLYCKPLPAEACLAWLLDKIPSSLPVKTRRIA